jgi:ribulose-phosphate 3-epimerase
VTPATASDVLAAGADCLIAGTAVFGKPDYAAAIAAIRAAAPRGLPDLTVSSA